METKQYPISGIPTKEWGRPQDSVWIAVHGSGSNKSDAVIEILAEEAEKKGAQVISFDLPQHGDRIGEEAPCKVMNGVGDLRTVMEYTKKRWKTVNLFACSLGAYFSLLAYRQEPLRSALFLSPVVDMERLIQNMMTWFSVTPQRLREEQEIETPIGQTLYWDYYCYVKEHPIDAWNVNTAILYGAQDTLCEFDTIDRFTGRFGCRLEIVEQGEHYFHTEEQLAVFREWIHRNI